MPWTPLKSRALKFDWLKHADRTIDSYILWADASEFLLFEPAMLRADANSNRSATQKPVDSVLVAFEVRLPLPRSGSAAYKQLKKSIWPPLAQIGKRYATGVVPMKQLTLFFDPTVQKHFPRVELSLPLSVPTAQARKAFARALAMPTAPLGEAASGATTVFAAVIDDGCAFANQAFLKPDGSSPKKARIERLWFQEDRAVGVNPKGIGFTAADLDRMLSGATRRGRLDEAACYAALEEELRKRSAHRVADDWRDQMRAGAAHGTHVLDTVAGNTNPLARYHYGSPDDPAQNARILFVQLPRSAIADTSAASMTAFVFEALAYLRGVVGAKGKAVINLSYGALAGPHDGTTLLEQALDHFLEVENLRKKDEVDDWSIVLPAGNGYDSRTHACVVATGDARWHEMPLQLLPDDPTDTFVEIWYARHDTDSKSMGGIAIDVELIAPDGSHSGPVALDEFVEWSRGDALPMAAVMHLRKPTAGGGKKHMALVALAPTGDAMSRGRRAPHGVWTLRVRNRGGLAIPVDAWIERDDSPFGSGRSRSQATFLSAGIGAAPGDPHAAAYPISRRACLNSFANGKRTWAVAGCSLHPPTVADYSASGPGKQGTYAGPDLVAPCEDTPDSAILAAGTRSAQPAYMNGTSVAAAVFSRQLVNSARSRDCLPDPDSDVLLPRPRKHPGDIDYAEPALRRGRGLLKPIP
jgi:hypothetical protein